MLTIQEVGTEILGNNPRKFYVLGGPEYGIKKKYINHLAEFYHQPIKESPSVHDIINLMSVRHIIPLQPMVYVIRYDEDFISRLNDVYANTIQKTNIIGTIICLIDDEKQLSKCAKYLPNNTVSIDPVNPKFLEKYLKSDYPELDVKFINWIIKIATDYNQAYNMCGCINILDDAAKLKLTEASITQLFGHEYSSTEKQLQLGVAARNFKYLLDVVATYDDDLDKIYYTCLQTMIELDKLMDNPKTDSPLKPYVKLWTRQDVYYMFMNTYKELQDSRSRTTDVQNSLIYLFGLLQFKNIPSPEVMEWNS